MSSIIWRSLRPERFLKNKKWKSLVMVMERGGEEKKIKWMKNDRGERRRRRGRS